MKLILIFSMLFLFYGCQLSPKKATSPKKETEVAERGIISHMIRGKIKTQFFEKNTKQWHYKLDVMDIASNSLKTFNFKYPKKLYDVGDLIYVIFDQNDKKNIKNLYLIKKAYKKQKTTKTKNHKRTKTRKTPWISTPKTETIKLN